ncbi:uncharacterized protein LOC128128017 [Lactuca sativa]|uniref:uncharacterized protein LOC128128017 n=1 Tax=Lactuca sativa TaxID=4236 RepID=UPI0022AFFD8C|nr:uncharacterized protein LOC128128017 [Lactuca sativa]
MSSRRSGRFTRVTPEEERIPIGAYVRAPGDVPETPLNPNASRGWDQGRGRGRGRARGAVTAPIPVQSAHGSSGSHRDRGRGRGRGRGRAANTITREELADEIARAIRDTLPDVVCSGTRSNNGHHGNHDQRGCSYKTFMNCKPPIFNGEIDPVLSSTWIMEIEGTFDGEETGWWYLSGGGYGGNGNRNGYRWRGNR